LVGLVGLSEEAGSSLEEGFYNFCYLFGLFSIVYLLEGFYNLEIFLIWYQYYFCFTISIPVPIRTLN